MLSEHFATVRRLRHAGQRGDAIALARERPSASDEDAFECFITFATCDAMDDALSLARDRRWRLEWCANAARALGGLVTRGDPGESLRLARAAVGAQGASPDVVAIYLNVLQQTGQMDEARAYLESHGDRLPQGEPLLALARAELAMAMRDWSAASRNAGAVLVCDPGQSRALLIAAIAELELGDTHASLSHAGRAWKNARGDPLIALALMRAHLRLGDPYGAIGVLDAVAEEERSAELRIEAGIAHMALGQHPQAIRAFEAALAMGSRDPQLLKHLLEIRVHANDQQAIESLWSRCREAIEGDMDCMKWIAVNRLRLGDRNGAESLFQQGFAVARQQIGRSFHVLPWPVPEFRLRHDYEQLALLEQRGRLDSGGKAAMEVLRAWLQPGSTRPIAPTGEDGTRLRGALDGFHYLPRTPFSAVALGVRDWASVEQRYLAGKPMLVVLDEFLSPEALASLRRFSEESTVWKSTYEDGYVGAFLSMGFCPPALLAVADELRLAMPKVIGNFALNQSWGFKYDSGLKGIRMHADTARVNLNFWIAPDSANEDPESGGLVIYDIPPPLEWAFQDYNGNQGKAEAFVRESGSRAIRVPHRENRAVLFDSYLLHATDEIHFKRGYENRRVNITLLFGPSR